MTDIRIGDDDGILYLFPKDQENGFPLLVIDGPKPAFVAGGSQYEIPFLFGVCADQQVRSALYEYLKGGLLTFIIEALEREAWVKAAEFVAALSEADAYSVLKYKSKAP